MGHWYSTGLRFVLGAQPAVSTREFVESVSTRGDCGVKRLNVYVDIFGLCIKSRPATLSFFNRFVQKSRLFSTTRVYPPVETVSTMTGRKRVHNGGCRVRIYRGL